MATARPTVLDNFMGSPLLPARGTATRRNGFNRCRGGRVFGQPSGLQDRLKRTKFEIPFGHAFDKRGVSSSKSAVRVGGQSVFDQPSRSAPYNTPLRSNDSESERSITTWAPARASFSPSAVIVLTPTF